MLKVLSVARTEVKRKHETTYVDSLGTQVPNGADRHNDTLQDASDYIPLCRPSGGDPACAMGVDGLQEHHAIRTGAQPGPPANP